MPLVAVMPSALAGRSIPARSRDARRGRTPAVCLLLMLALAMPASTEERIDTAMNWKIRQEGTERSRIMRTMHFLTDVYGPRLTGSPNHKNAAEWAVRQMEAWGLVNGRLEPFDFGRPGWLNERLSAHIVAPVKDHLVSEELAWKPGTTASRRARP
jgi:hypothetical protein